MLLVVPLWAQMPGVEMTRNAKKVEIPFEWRDNFIVVKVLFQNFLPLKFIIDTGAEHTILTKKEFATLLQLPFERTITLTGTDMKEEVKAHIARKVTLDLPNVRFIKDILVLDDDYLKLGEFSGLDIQGIIGAEAFAGYVVKFDYIRQIITMYDLEAFRPSDRRKFQEVPIDVFRSKPYIICPAKINSDTTVQLKLLLDTGAALSILLHTYSTPSLSLPERVIKGRIGSGFSGVVEGFVGRIKELNIGNSPIHQAIANFQELPDLSDTVHLNGRNGLIGSEVLSRFTTIIDFANSKAYFQPNRYFKEKYVYDRSGITLVAHGQNLNRFIVYDVLPNSPAAEAGILRGDEILRINYSFARLGSLSTMTRLFQKKIGKTMRLTILRNEKKMNISFQLRELI
jgi:predicted aspartyl protease